MINKETYYKKLSSFFAINEFDSIYNSFYNCYSEIKEFLKDSNETLDVGCGIGLLVNYLKEEKHNIKGIDNYYYNERYKKIFNILNIDKSIDCSSFENFSLVNKYDLIICHNTIEHFENWKEMINKLIGHLNSKGKIVLMGPNYTIPFDVHFMIPLIINKKITYKIFKNKINNFEIQNKKVNMWNGLNLIKYTELIKHLNNSHPNINFKLDKNYFSRIIIKLIKNSKLKKSTHSNSFFYKLILSISLFINKVYLFKYYKFLPIRFHPFVKIIITKD